SLLPELPPIADAVPGFDLSGWFGILAPAATPVPLITRLNQELRQAVNTSEVRARVAALGGEVIGNTPSEFRVHIRDETAKWAHIIRSAKVRADAGQ
ncbi:MAG TPA: tripartite tricarboxylate transporter substrate-binding protein, partial [Burkholderiales bacterium]|nr:tripartite tricarboxylate transporter substrate-binding protein [Burkholderiales bacterium]